MITPVLGVLGAMLGVFGAIMLGFQNVDIGIFIGVTIIGAVVIWILKR
jgi:membrane associated rhomboid family serine protease